MKKGFLGSALGIVALTFAGATLAAGSQTDRISSPSAAKDLMAQASPGGAGMGSGAQRSPGGAGTTTESGPGATSPAAPGSAAKPANPPQSIVGKDVVNREGKKVGEVEKIAGDQIIVSVGGFLGLGAHNVALSWKDLDMTGAGDKAKLMTSMNEKELKALPEYKDPSKARTTERPASRTSPGGGGATGGGTR